MNELFKRLKYLAGLEHAVDGVFPTDYEDCYDDGMYDGKIELAKELIDLLKATDSWQEPV